MTSNQLSFQSMLENQRHNRETEAEAIRSNKAREAETHRSNLVNEGIGKANAYTKGFESVSKGLSNFRKSFSPLNFIGAALNRRARRLYM